MINGMKIETKNLTKRFGQFTAVDRLNLVIEPGESYGFLGPNGAGKTTTLLMILGIHRPTFGQVLLDGQEVRSDAFAIKQRIGVVAEYQSFYDEMSAWEYLMFFGTLFKVEEAAKKGQALLEELGLWEWRDVLIGGYSTGMKKKLGFARALLHAPDLLILDEPVSGLDPFGIIQVREMLKEQQSHGRTILISSHILSEVEHTVNRVGIIANGRLILQDDMAAIRRKVSGFERIDLVFLSIDYAQVDRLSQLPFIDHIERDGNQISVVTRDDADYREALGRFVLQEGLIMLGMNKAEKTLEEAFVTITEQNLADIAGEKRQVT